MTRDETPTPLLSASRIDGLVEFSRALAEGSDPGEGPDLDDDVLRRARDCLRLIGRAWSPAPIVVPGPSDPPTRVGRFSILRELGRGGHGLVFLAFDPSLRRQVALKVPGAAVLSTPTLRQRFHREAQAASRLDHPHIVPVYEAGREGLVHYIASAYCDGPTLGVWLRDRDEPVPPRMAAGLAADLARAVQHAHDRDVLHRDLKPSNILLDRDDSRPFPRITDFGLAKLLDEDNDHTVTGAVLGSPPYMAPEQAEGRNSAIGVATDVYALGVILYEVLTGHPAFRGESRAHTLRLVVEADPTPPRRLRPGLPRDLETIVLKSMARSPERRYQSAGAMADDLDRFLRNETIEARPASLGRRALIWSRRRPGPAALMGLALALVVGLGCYQVKISGHNRDLRGAVARAEVGEREARRQTDLVTRFQDVLRHRVIGYQIRQAQREHEMGRDETAQHLLESARREIGPGTGPGFAWSYLHHQATRRVELLGGHEGVVTALAWSPDGRLLASGDDRGLVLIRDRATGRSWTTARPHRSMIRHLVWSPDGRSFAAASFADSGPRMRMVDLLVWDAATGRERAAAVAIDIVPHESWFTPDGLGLVARWPSGKGLGSPARSWRIDDAGPSPSALVPTGEGAEALRQAGLFDDRLEAMARVIDGDDPRSGAIAGVWDGTVPRGLAFTRDGRLTVQGLADGSFTIHHTGCGDPIALGRFSANGLLLYHHLRADSDPRGRITAADREHIARLGRIGGRDGEPPRLVAIDATDYRDKAAFSPDGSTLACWGLNDHALRLRDAETGREIGRFSVGDLDSSTIMAWSPDGRFMALGASDHMVRVRRLDDAPERSSLPGHAPAEAWSVAWSSDGRTLYSGGDDHMVRGWDAGTGRAVATWTGHESLVTRVAMSPDGRTLASASFDRTVRLWDVGTGAARAVLRGHTGRVRAVAWSPDGRSLASLGIDNIVRLWDAATGQPSGEPLRDPAITRADGLAFAPDGLSLVHGAGNAVAIWDLATRRARLIPVSTTQFVRAVAHVRNGATVAMGCGDGRVLLHDVATGVTTPVLGAHAREVFDLTFSPDGRYLASCGTDAIVKLWDVVSREEVLALAGGDGPLHGVAFDPGGHRLAAASHLGPIRLWRGDSREASARVDR